MTTKITVAVIFGGRSGEHEISLASAASIMEALDDDKYRIIPIGITKEGNWLTSGDPMGRLYSASRGDEPQKNPLPESLPEDELQLIPLESLSHEKRSLNKIDVAFPILHGPYGEDGTIQGLLEMAGIPYVGAGVMSSSVGMDKEMMKALFARRRLPQVKHMIFTRKRWEADNRRATDKIEAEIRYPAFVKPCNLGSSVGISKAEDRQELKEAMNLACRFDRKIMVEEGIDCREIECSVLGNDEPLVSLAGEIVPKRSFYDYEAKYTSGLADIIIPAPLDEALMNKIRRIALEAFKAIDCCGMARVDFFLERDSNTIYLNEINTIPGFTSTSVYTRLWESTGIGYSQLLDKLIALALERHKEKERSSAPFVPPSV